MGYPFDSNSDSSDFDPSSGMIPGYLGSAQLAVQQAAIDRQRVIAAQLQKDSLTPDNGQMVSGHYISSGTPGVIARIAQALIGGSNQSALDQKQLALAKGQDDALRNYLNSALQPTTVSTPAQTVTQTSPDSSQPAINLPTDDGSTAQFAAARPVIKGTDTTTTIPGQTVQKPSLLGQVASQVGMPMVMQAATNGPLAAVAKLLMNTTANTIGKNNEITTEQKNNNYMGISATEAAAVKRAADLKASLYEAQPGTTVTNLQTGQRTVAPDFKTGIQGGFDANGNSFMTPITGSNLLAQLDAQKAGAVTTATKAAEQPFSLPSSVPVPGGPRFMTPKQQIDYANGVNNPAPQAPAVTPPTGAPTVPQTGGTTTFTGNGVLSPQLLAWMRTNDPESYRSAMAQINQPQASSGSPPGGALQTPQQAKVDEEKATAGINAAKVQESTRPLLAAIDQALAINDKVPYGSWGGAEFKANLSNLPVIGDGQAAKYAGMWHQLMGQNIMNGIATSGLARMDIPVVNAIQAANGVPMENHPDARKAMLLNLRDQVLNHSAAIQNVVPSLNQPGITSNTTQIPIGARPLIDPSAIDAEIARRAALRK